MAKKRYYSGDYAGMDMRRRQEYEDSMMIKEDQGSIANLPQQVIMKEYPKSPYYECPKLNDTIRGIDYQQWDDSHGGKLKKNKNPEKY